MLDHNRPLDAVNAYFRETYAAAKKSQDFEPLLKGLEALGEHIAGLHTSVEEELIKEEK